MESLAEGGAAPRRLIQGRSLFGLEYYRERSNGTEVVREHGYSAGKFDINKNECRFRLWPRQNIKRYDGGLGIAADVRFALNEDDAIEDTFELSLSILGGPNSSQDSETVGVGATEVTLSIQNTSAQPSANRENLLEVPPSPTNYSERLLSVPRWHLRAAPQHISIRTVEQDSFKSAMSQHRAAWLVADWGLGKDGFLYSALAANAPQRDIFRLSCEGVNSIELLTAEATKQWGMTFQNFCINVAASVNSVLVLDNISEGTALDGGNMESWSRRLDKIVEAALDIAQNLSIVLVRRLTPGPSRFPVTQLHPLDEPDCARYISNHSDGGVSLAAPRILEKLYAKSEGIPMHLDRMLEQLQTISLADLPDNASEDLDVTGKGEPIPRALVQAVASLRDSTSKYTRRSLRLLKVLTVLSHGEIFQNLKRFDSIEPFFPENVQQLRDLALIEAVPLVSIGANADHRNRAITNDPTAPKLLLVPRPVRDYIRSVIGEDERRAIVDGAMEIYFGSRWREGKPSLRPLTKIVVWENGMSGLGNHHTIIVSAVGDYLTRHSEQLFKRVFRIAEAYLEALLDADKFRDLQHASEELFRLLDAAGRKKEAARVASYHGIGLRMLHQVEESVRVFETALAYAPSDFAKDWYASIFIGLALAHQTLKDHPSAIKAANEVMVRSDQMSVHYHQAKMIIAECSAEEKDKKSLIKELSLLEADSRKRDYITSANNMVLKIVDLLEGKNEKIQWLDRVIDSKGDHYNRIRAAIKKAKILIALGEDKKLGSTERRIISEAYSYLYSQRLGVLFDDCHNVLWRLNASGDRKSFLLRLFRFSSFLWRVFGRDQKETEYLSQLKVLVPASSDSLEGGDEKNNFSYYTARLKALDSPKDRES